MSQESKTPCATTDASRRGFLGWFCALGAGLMAVLMGIPMVRFVIAPLTEKVKGGRIRQRVGMLGSFPVGKPVEKLITNDQRDAWTQYPQQVIGKVWLVRRSGEDVAPEEAEVVAFSAVCPHAACDVGYEASDKEFICPCHGARFAADGELIEGKQANPSPRGLDPLDCEIELDDDGQAWVVVNYVRYKVDTPKREIKV